VILAFAARRAILLPYSETGVEKEFPMKSSSRCTTSRIYERSTYILAVIASLSMLFLAFACGPSAPEKGSPAYFWAAAAETYAAGDYMKTMDHLDGILEQNDNEYTARAMPWSLLLSSGLASGYSDLADKYQAGGKKNKEVPGNFFKQVGAYRSLANRLTLHFADTFSKFGSLKDDPVTLALPFPRGSVAEVGQLSTVAAGNLLPASVADQAEKRALERGILLATTHAAGAGDDSAKAEETLKASQGKVPRATFLLAMANALYDSSQVYASNKINDSEKMKILCQRAQDVLKLLPESFETKDLGVKIRLAMKEPGT
jgi:hypothetical protein